MQGFTNIDLAVLVIYLIAVLLFGVHFAKKDMKGNIVDCNYSKLCGPLKIRKFLSFGKICFNPNVNDVNLEDDAERNLFSRRRNGIGVIP